MFGFPPGVPATQLPYNINVFKSTDGAEVMNLHCLECPGGYLDGRMIVCLGSPTRDGTDGLVGAMPIAAIGSWMLPPCCASANPIATTRHRSSAHSHRTDTRFTSDPPQSRTATRRPRHRAQMYRQHRAVEPRKQRPHLRRSRPPRQTARRHPGPHDALAARPRLARRGPPGPRRRIRRALCAGPTRRRALPSSRSTHARRIRTRRATRHTHLRPARTFGLAANR